MAAPKRTQAQIEANRAEIARLYLHGWTQAAIAAELGMTQQMVSYDLQRLYEVWRESAAHDIDAAKARELARIDELERTYWAEWEASRQERTSSTTKRIQRGPDSKGTEQKPPAKDIRDEATLRKEQRLGDPRYLAGVQWCIERRCAIAGINAAIESKLSGRIQIEIIESDDSDLAD